MAVTAITSGVKVRVYVQVDEVAAGAGPSGLGAGFSNNPGFGQGNNPGVAGGAQTRYYQAAEMVLGAGGSITLAEIDAAIKAAADDIAGATGTPLITAAELAIINGWNTGQQ